MGLIADTPELWTTNRAGSAQTLRPTAQEVSTPMQTTDYCCSCGCGEPTNSGARWIKGHNLKAPHPSERILEQDCGFTSPCWLWQGTVATTGYGQIRHSVVGFGRTVMAHRYFWEEAHGPVPNGLELDHLCRVRSCCNPEHLEPVTRRENILRGAATKVTDAEARTIRRRREAGETCTAIARDYPIGESGVRAIATGQCRAYLWD
jgi:hypothetical protein